MPFYEFECKQGHVTEKLVPIGTKDVECETCVALNSSACMAGYPRIVSDVRAKRILSPTPTTFVCAGGRKL